MISTAKDEGFVVRAGGHSRVEILRLLRSADVMLNVHAETLLDHPVFDNPESQNLRIVERTVEELGFEHGAVQSRVFSAARNRGLALCPLVTGPYLRMAMIGQSNAPDSVLSAGRAPTGAIHVASEPLSEDVEYPKGFYLRVVDGQAWLRGYRCDDTYVWAPDHRLAFQSPGR
ncbi:hypothetical protein J2W14_003867 [Pseudarthrobacter oxydans]|uniref:hypothetical protein n=1 Tax=Pseudarthrobacter oxydans TaxID=1671 RepID=UPI002786359B|nr:hypothetical protein [Pseudarthrobacter oxydans]MDP9984442.1 hypothetical protein [Pseudarthrobacter oxydans]